MGTQPGLLRNRGSAHSTNIERQTDEDWKLHWDPPQDKLGINVPSVACDNTGCSNQLNVFLADTITPKDWEFQAVCCGKTAEGEPYNYGTDVFTLLGREQQTLETATNDCPAVFWDGSTWPARSGYVSQYHLYPPNGPTPTVGPTTTPAATTEAPATEAPATSAPVTALPSPPPTTVNVATATPAPTTAAPSTAEPTLAPLPSGKDGLTSGAVAQGALMAVALALAAFVLFV